MVIIAKATDSEPASVVCDMNSPSSKWLTTLRVNFSKEVRRPCSVSAGCCFGRGKQGECLGQVRVLGGVGNDVVSEEKRGQALQKWGPRTMWELQVVGHGVGGGGQWQASRRSGVQTGKGREASMNRGSCDLLESSILHSNSWMTVC